MNQARDPNKIYLTFCREGDRLLVRDQEGREVYDISALSLTAAVDSVAQIKLTVPDARINTSRGTAHTGDRE